MAKVLLLALITGLTGISFTLHAQEENVKSKLDNYLNLLEKNDKAMCAVQINKNGNLFYENQIGYASVEDSIPITAHTKFRIGSITKMFTAVMIFQLVEENKLTLDTKLAEFYPDIANAQKITISQMLNHHSGIHNFTDDEAYEKYMTIKKSKEEMLGIITAMQPDFEPGEKSAYSNSNYVLLGYIIEDITGMKYAQALKQRITGNLNMTDTYYGGKINPENNEAESYRFENGQWQLQPETNMSIPGGAGAIVSTPGDLIVFITALFDNKLVSESSLEQMMDMQDHFGRGLLRFPFGKFIAYGFNGGIDGFQSNLAYFPEKDLTLSVLANGLNYNFNDILIGILSISFNAPFKIPDFSAQPVTLTIEQLNKYTGEYESDALPLKIKLFIKENDLYGQATGQQPFPLIPYSESEFKFEQAGIIIEFQTGTSGQVNYDSFVLNQAGGKYLYKRE
ncbi:MAG: serine hydrolase [Calditrichaceae bacterium]